MSDKNNNITEPTVDELFPEVAPKASAQIAEPSVDDIALDVTGKTPLELELQNTPGFFERQKIQGLGFDPKGQATIDELSQFEKLAKEQGQVDAVTNFIQELPKKAPGAVLDTAFLPFELIDRGAAGLVDRTTEVAGDVVEAATDPTKDLSLKEVVESFLSPRATKKAREEIEKRFPGQSLSDKAGKLYYELFPKISIADVALDDEQWLSIARGLNEDVLGGIFTDQGLAAGLRLGTNIFLSPSTYATFGARVPRKLSDEAKAARLGEDVSTAMERVIGEAGKADLGPGLSIEGERGIRNFVAIKLPMIEKPIVAIKGQAALNAIDNFRTSIDKPLARKFMTRSGFEGEVKASIAREVEKGANLVRLKELLPSIKMLSNSDEAVIRYVNNIKNVGEEAGIALSKKQGLKLSDEQLKQARAILPQLEAFTKIGNDVFFEATGVQLSDRARKSLSPEMKAAEKARIKKEYGVDLPDIIVDGQDVTWSRLGYDEGRMLSREAVEARTTAMKNSEAAEQWRQANAASGLNISPSAAKARSPISDVAMDYVYKMAYGIDDAVVKDPFQVAFQKVAEKIEAASNVKYYKKVRDQYGFRSRERVAEAIELAKKRVEGFRRAGRAVPSEDLLLSKYSLSDFRELNTKFFDRIDRLYPDAMVDKAQFRLYPKPVAERLESLLSQPSRDAILQGVAFIQDQWSKNALTNAARILPQAVDNLTRAIAAGLEPANILEETRNVFRPEAQKDWISKLGDSIPAISETLTDMTEFYGKKIVVNSFAKKNAEVTHAVDAYMKTLHGLERTGKLERVVNALRKTTIKDTLKTPAGVVRLLNENPVSEGIRRFAGSPDVIAKRAYFRQLMKQGYTADEAVYQVAEKFMDFSTTTQAVRAARYVMPFASFMFKNLETTLALALARPGLVNVLDPEDGYLKKAFLEANGLDPDVAEIAKKAFPFYRDEIPAMILKGTDQAIAGASGVNRMLSRLATFAMSEEDKALTEEEMAKNAWLFSVRLPTFLQASHQALDFSDPMSRFSSPVLLAFGVALSGTNWATGQNVEGTDAAAESLGARNSLREAARLANPVNYSRAYQKAFDLINERLPALRESLQNGLITKDLEHIFRINIDNDKDLNSFRLNKREVMTLTNPRFFGLGRMDRLDATFLQQQIALLQRGTALIDGNRSLLVREKIKKGDTEAARVLNTARSIIADVRENIRLYEALRNRLETNVGLLKDDPTIQGLGSIQIEFEDDAPTGEAVPVEPGEGLASPDDPTIEDIFGEPFDAMPMESIDPGPMSVPEEEPEADEPSVEDLFGSLGVDGGGRAPARALPSGRAEFEPGGGGAGAIAGGVASMLPLASRRGSKQEPQQQRGRGPAQVMEEGPSGQVRVFDDPNDPGVFNAEELPQFQPALSSQVDVDSSGQVVIRARAGAEGSRQRQTREQTRDVDLRFIENAEKEISKKYKGRKLTKKERDAEAERLNRYFLELNSLRGSPSALENIRRGRPAREVAI